jgi:hypothetical protein
MIVGIRRLACEVRSLSPSCSPAYLAHHIADMIDQGRLVPSLFSHLKTIMYTGITFTVH